MKYYFVSYVANTKMGTSILGNHVLYAQRGLSLNEITEHIKKEQDAQNVVILNIQFLTKKQWEELKGETDE